MAQDITLLGASYSEVPSVELPKTGGGTASFTDVTDTTATDSNVVSGYYFYTSNGVKTQGSMTNRGAISKTFTPSTSAQSYTVPAGYHNGSGTVTCNAVSTQTKTATPSSSSQTIDPDSGKFLSSVTVNAISSRANTYLSAVSSFDYTSSNRTFTLSAGGSYIYWLALWVGDFSNRGSATATVKRDSTTISAVKTQVINTNHRLYLYRVMHTVTTFTITISDTATSSTTAQHYGVAIAVK